MDVIDRANELNDWLLGKQLAAQTGHHQDGTSLIECEECADPIPEGRRVALPGVRLCIGCQTLMEKRR